MKSVQWKDTTFSVGDTISVEYKVKEKDKERIQPFKGVVISIRGMGENKTFTVRKIAVDGIGVERIFPLSSPLIANLKVLSHPRKRIKTAKLYYLRERKGKKAKL
jgi:large subunit ribosomal protein L19